MDIERNELITGEFSDITTNDMHIIEAVGLKGHRNMSAVAQQLGITVGTLTITINRLVKKGYVIRQRSEKDKRVVHLALSEKGQRAYAHHQQFHEQLTPQEKPKTVPGENPLGKGTEHRKNKTIKVPQEVEDWYELTGKNRILHISRSLLNKRVFSFSIAQDGMCSMKSKEGFTRVAAIRDFPGKEIKALCAIINREGEIQAKVNGKYLWISRRRRQT